MAVLYCKYLRTMDDGVITVQIRNPALKGIEGETPVPQPLFRSGSSDSEIPMIPRWSGIASFS